MPRKDLTTNPTPQMGGDAGGDRSPRPPRFPRRGAGPALLLLCTLVPGCTGEGWPAASSADFPPVDLRTVFPELRPALGADRPGIAEPVPEERRSAFGAPKAAPATASTPAAAVPAAGDPPLDSVPLGAGLLGELPAAARSWRWASDPGGATLIVHGADRDRPDAVVYAEAFSPVIAVEPSAELARFRFGVLGGEAAGLGFDPLPRSFSGWRWVGENRGGATIRLGRFEGTWRRREKVSAGAAADAVPAYLILGSVHGQRESLGVHLAVLCSRAPACPVAADLATLLDSIHPAADGGRLDRLRRGALRSVEELARDAGVEVPAPPAAPEEGGRGGVG